MLWRALFVDLVTDSNNAMPMGPSRCSMGAAGICSWSTLPIEVHLCGGGETGGVKVRVVKGFLPEAVHEGA